MTAEGDEQKLRGLAFSLNLHRRHLNREQKRQILEESIKADPQMSDREHGRRTGVSDKTAGAVRRDLESTAEIPQSDERVSGDGRTRPSTQPPRPSLAEHEAIITAGLEAGSEIPNHEERMGADGVVQPASKPRPSLAEYEAKIDAVIDEAKAFGKEFCGDENAVFEYANGMPPGFNPGDLDAPFRLHTFTPGPPR